ncbi:hypothetical protein FQN50_006320 [Emmonsiellopsis sp. PD_5]|nr:hypothetical protein FQN50_006320 [Emmonsiellopsis sp. PD_5]
MTRLSPGWHRFLDNSNGLAFCYTVRGDPAANKPMLVIQCPGWGIGPNYLISGLQPLEESFLLVYFHPRGSAGSSRPVDPTQMSSFTMAADLERFRQFLQIDQFPAMLGHSNGGTIVLAYAELWPQRVAKIILVGHRLLGFDDSERFMKFREERRGDPRYERAYAAAEKFRPTSDEGLADFVVSVAPIYFYDPEMHVPRYLRTLGDEPVSIWCMDRMRECDHHPRVDRVMIGGLPEVKAKTLMLFGRQDSQCTRDNAFQTRDLGVEHARIEILDRCGHYPWLEKPEETFSIIREFVEE